MAHAHHDHAPDSLRSLLKTTSLQAVTLLLQLIVGILSFSVALIADALHLLSDVVAGIVAYNAQKLAQRPADERATYGYGYAPDLSYYFRAALLIVVGVFAMTESVFGLAFPEREVNAKWALPMAIFGLLANIIGHKWLAPHRHEHENYAIFDDHLKLDAASSGVAILSMVVVWWTHSHVVDVIGGVTIGVIMVVYGIRKWREKKVRNRILRLMPEDFPIEDFKQAIRNVYGVEGIDHVHVESSPTGLMLSICVHVDPAMLMMEWEAGPRRDIVTIAHRFGITHHPIEPRPTEFVPLDRVG
jgi:cobalt-zinc-cadmium efflux system protein